uniref:Uncharacterized protein n=1 Tax=Tanacetum cinerariifolium TaxID=118510 RepID=A0A699ITA9_TANCI|nr:hypothetical protein [Tanacetum cinerariifolium]
MRNRIKLHKVHDDTLLGTLKFVSKIDYCQIYEAVIPDGMIYDKIKLSMGYKTYLDYATRKVPPNKVPNEHAGKTKDTSEGTYVKPRVPEVFKEDSFDNDDDSWGDSESESDDVNDEDDDNNDNGDDDNSDDNDDGGNDDGGNEDNYEENPSFALADYEKEEQDEEYVYTQKNDKSDDEDKMFEEEDDDVAKELYKDLSTTQGLRDTNMTNAKQGGEDQQSTFHESGFVQEEEAHVTLTTVHDKTEGPLQSSSISFDFTSKLLNLDDPSSNINFVMNTSTVPLPPPLVYPSSHLTTITQQQTPDSITTTTNPTMTLLEIPNFACPSIPGIADNYLASKVKEESTQAKEPEFKAADTVMHQDQGIKSCHIDDQLDNKAAPKHDWFQKHDKPLTPVCSWNKSNLLTLNRLRNGSAPLPKNGPAFNLLKGTCKSFVKLEYHFEECYKAVNDPLGTKATKYGNIEGIKDMVPTIWNSVKVAYNKHDDNVLYKFKEGNFPRLNLYDIEDMLLLLVQKKLSNLDVDDLYNLGVALQMFTRRIVILHRVKDLQLGVKVIERSLISPN